MNFIANGYSLDQFSKFVIIEAASIEAASERLLAFVGHTGLPGCPACKQVAGVSYLYPSSSKEGKCKYPLREMTSGEEETRYTRGCESTYGQGYDEATAKISFADWRAANPESYLVIGANDKISPRIPETPLDEEITYSNGYTLRISDWEVHPQIWGEAFYRVTITVAGNEGLRDVSGVQALSGKEGWNKWADESCPPMGISENVQTLKKRVENAEVAEKKTLRDLLPKDVPLVFAKNLRQELLDVDYWSNAPEGENQDDPDLPEVEQGAIAWSENHVYVYSVEYTGYDGEISYPCITKYPRNPA